jgi:hypothetical protein
MTVSPFQQALGAEFSKLPKALQRFHHTDAPHRFQGRASVTHGRGLLAAVAIKLGGFPPAAADIPMTITVMQKGQAERWDRLFGTHKTTSDLRYDNATSTIIERFGMVACAIVPTLVDGTLNVAVVRASVLGIPLPQIFSPRSSSREWQDDKGRFCFDIAAYLGRDTLLIRYSGWLEADDPTPS